MDEEWISIQLHSCAHYGYPFKMPKFIRVLRLIAIQLPTMVITMHCVLKNIRGRDYILLEAETPADMIRLSKFEEIFDTPEGIMDWKSEKGKLFMEDKNKSPNVKAVLFLDSIEKRESAAVAINPAREKDIKDMTDEEMREKIQEYEMFMNETLGLPTVSQFGKNIDEHTPRHMLIEMLRNYEAIINEKRGANYGDTLDDFASSHMEPSPEDDKPGPEDPCIPSETVMLHTGKDMIRYGGDKDD